jgi:hypothetical protein
MQKLVSLSILLKASRVKQAVDLRVALLCRGSFACKILKYWDAYWKRTPYLARLSDALSWWAHGADDQKESWVADDMY